MGEKVINVRIEFDDISGRIRVFDGEVIKKGHDDLHSGRWIIQGSTKKDLFEHLNNFI